MKIRFKKSEIEFSRFEFVEFHAVKSYTVYSCADPGTAPGKLTQRVRVERYSGNSNAKGIDFYFRLRDSENWKYCTQLTGLRYYQTGTYYGDDSRGSKSLMVFHFIGQHLIIDYFNSFYPFTPTDRNLILSELKKTLPDRNALTDLKNPEMDLFTNIG